MTKHRVLALVTDAFGGYGGIAQYNRDFLSALGASESIDTVEILPRLAPGEREPIPGKLVQRAPVYNKFKYAITTISMLQRTKPTIIFCGHLHHARLAELASNISGASLVSQLHGTEIWGAVPSKLLRSMEASRLALCVSRDTRAKLLSKTNLPPERAVVLNNTFDRSFAPGDRQAARAKFKVSIDQFVISTVARMDIMGGYKGHDKIIPLLPELASKGKNVMYLIAGVGEDRTRLETLAKKFGVGDRVRFLGKVPAADLPDLYRASDLFALPSTGEGFGIVYLEAMACGTPAVGLSVGGAPDALCGGISRGFCVHPDEFSRCLLELVLSARRLEPREVLELNNAYGQDVFRSRTEKLFASL